MAIRRRVDDDRLADLDPDLLCSARKAIARGGDLTLVLGLQAARDRNRAAAAAGPRRPRRPLLDDEDVTP